MPALPSVPQVLKMSLQFAVGEFLKAIVTDHIKYSGTAPTNSDLNTFAASVGSNFGSHLASLFTADRMLEKVDVIDLTSPTAAVGTASPGIHGTRTDVALPAATCVVAQRKVDRRYRGGHSRQYWPAGGDTALADAQTWGTAFLTAWDAGMAAYLGGVETSAWAGASFVDFVNVSYYLGFTNFLYPSGRYHVKPTLRSTPLVDLIAVNSTNPKIGSQRRRNLQSS